jgi:hypothetical protein
MISQHVAIAHHSSQQTRLFFRGSSHHKKCRANISFAQNVQNCGGVGAVRSVVKRQRDDAAPGRNAGKRFSEELAARILHALVREIARNACGSGRTGRES